MTRNPAAARIRFSWSWRFNHDWRVWIDRTPWNCSGLPAFRWRLNCGPLHVVRFK